jgi:hypothetical protein
VRGDRGQHRGGRAGAAEPSDEAREIVGQLVELAGADQALPAIDVGMDDHQVGHDAAGFACRSDLLVVVDRGADAQPTDDAYTCHRISPYVDSTWML